MKNKKKNWRHILLRGSALMAAVLMCFAGSFPAFAAEDPADPGGSVTLIKAGTYRFNDVLTSTEVELNANFDFTVEVSVSGYEGVGHCDNITVSAELMDSAGMPFWYNTMRYNLVELVPPFEYVSTPISLLMYQTSYFDGGIGGIWDSDIYSDSIKTITVLNDQDVSVAFAEWFRNNTVPVSSSANVIEGEWTLKPVVSVPDASYSLAIDYTVSGDLKVSSDVSVPVIGSCSSLFVIVGDSYVVNVGGLCVSSDPSVSDLDPSLTYPIDIRFYKEFNNGEISYGGFAAPVTFDFGDGVVFDDPAFYQWFTSNAIPHREMWTLTERLQAVAASIWSVIVTIASTIVSNPLLLFTFGFLFLGGCIALFSRLLARR